LRTQRHGVQYIAGVPEHISSRLDDARQRDLLGDYTSAAAILDDVIAAAAMDGTVERVVALTRRAALVRYEGDLGRAAELLDEAARICEASSDMPTGHRCELEVERGRLLLETSDPDAADIHLELAVDVARTLDGAPDGRLELAAALAALGTARRRRGDYGEAEGLLLEAAAHARSAHEADPADRRATIDLAHVLDELGVLYKFSGDRSASEVAYAGALELLIAVGGQDHPDVATIEHNLGGLAHAHGDGATAEHHARRAVELHERSLGADHLATVLDRSALAAILEQQGATAEAETLLRDCADRLERTLGRDHHEVGVVCNNLAAIVQRDGRWEEAAELYQRAITIKERASGPASPSLAVTLNNLATMQRRRGHMADAAASYTRALDILVTSAGPDHPHVAVIRRNLARVAAMQGEVSDR
jgi:tetratricopeptide (TPR) repeat protein